MKLDKVMIHNPGNNVYIYWRSLLRGRAEKDEMNYIVISEFDSEPFSYAVKWQIYFAFQIGVCD